MLKQRIVTALWMLPLMLGMLPLRAAWLWAAFCGLISWLRWEYARMSGLKTENQSLSRRDVGVRRHRLRRRLDAAGYRLVRRFGVLAGRYALWLKFKWKLNGGWQALYRRLALSCRFVRTHVPRVLILITPLSLLAVMGLVVADVCALFQRQAFGKHRNRTDRQPGQELEGKQSAARFV